MDMNVDMQGAHDPQGELLADIDMTQAEVPAGGAVGGAGVVPSTLGAQQVVDMSMSMCQHIIFQSPRKEGTRGVMVTVVKVIAAPLMIWYMYIPMLIYIFLSEEAYLLESCPFR